MDIRLLRIPLYAGLMHPALNDFSELTDAQLKGYLSYEPAELSGIIEAVKWAVENPDFDFLSLDPEYRYTNRELYQYLWKLDKSLSKLKQTG